MSDDHKTPLFFMKKGYAKVEFIAVREEVKKWLDEGYTASSIYRLMQLKGNVRMNYRTFSAYTKMYINNKNIVTKRKNIPTQQSEGQKQKTTRQLNSIDDIPTGRSNTVIAHNPLPKPEDLM